MKIIITSNRAKKRIKKLDLKILLILKQRVNLFRNDEFNHVLNNHKLHGEYANCRSINITPDIRLIYRKVSDNLYHILEIGTHSELYS